MHEEVPTVTGKNCHGLQMFVKLPAAQELSTPQAFHVPKDQVPEWKNKDGTARVRVLAGSYQGQMAPFTPGNGKELTYLDVHLNKNTGKIEIPAPRDMTAFLLNIQGSVTAIHGENDETTAIEENAGAFFESDGDRIILQATGDGNSQFLFCGGIPNKEPLVSGGPFMMTTKERISQAKRDYGSGAMGPIEPLNVENNAEL